MEAQVLTPAPPDPPELPAGATRYPAWPWWFALVGFVVALIGTLFTVGLAAALLGAGPEDESPGFVVVATFAQGIIFVATAVFFASQVARPRAWHFGLRGTPLWPAIGWAALGVVAYFTVTRVYAGLVQPDVEQGTVEALGGDQGTIGLIVAGLMVIMVAPVGEELFYRGFFYRALRTRLSIWVAAAIDGVLFGAIHFTSDLGVEGLLLLPPLALLGFIYCLVYEKTGSLLPVIAMHALNNALAFGLQADDGWMVSVVALPIVIAGCILAPRLLPRARRPAPA